MDIQPYYPIQCESLEKYMLLEDYFYVYDYLWNNLVLKMKNVPVRSNYDLVSQANVLLKQIVLDMDEPVRSIAFPSVLLDHVSNIYKVRHNMARRNSFSIMLHRPYNEQELIIVLKLLGNPQTYFMLDETCTHVTHFRIPEPRYGKQVGWMTLPSNVTLPGVPNKVVIVKPAGHGKMYAYFGYKKAS